MIESAILSSAATHDRLALQNAFPTLFLLTGLALLAVWAARHRGLDNLAGAPVRRHTLKPQFTMWLFLAWLTAMAAGVYAIGKRIDPNSLAGLLASNGFVLILDGALIGVCLAVASKTFARGLKGFGLRLKNLPSDLAWAAAYVVAVWPLVIAGVLAVQTVGSLITGGEFTIPAHQTLQDLQTHNHLPLKILLTALAAVVVPIAEEMLFRGLIQTSLKSMGLSAWQAIAVCSGLFALAHYSTHAISIFFLSSCMGYAYEKSGSLFRPIAIHIYFNSFNILMALLNP